MIAQQTGPGTKQVSHARLGQRRAKGMLNRGECDKEPRAGRRRGDKNDRSKEGNARDIVLVRVFGLNQIGHFIQDQGTAYPQNAGASKAASLPRAPKASRNAAGRTISTPKNR
jgi:hypothetical protein